MNTMLINRVVCGLYYFICYFSIIYELHFQEVMRNLFHKM